MIFWTGVGLNMETNFAYTTLMVFFTQFRRDNCAHKTHYGTKTWINHQVDLV